MITLEPARHKSEYDHLLEIIFQQRTAYLEPKLDLVGMTSESFRPFFLSTGIAYKICRDEELAGLCWVEACQGGIHLRGLIVKPEFQGQGIGSEVLHQLEYLMPASSNFIELEVHRSNPGAKRLYSRFGYRVVRYLEPSGFYVLRKLVKLPISA